ncbi:MAG: hypothetical protein JWN14_3498, partial [Chthonomonadales bacterium]|nr:hypothetical protein [Chthonomonadales bacterium]
LLQRLVAATRFSMQVGLAMSKLVAYHAARQSEIDTVWVVDGCPEEVLAGVPLAFCPGLEEAQRRQLAKLGLRTFGDIARLPEREMQRRLGTLAGRLARLAQGQDGDPVRAKWPPPLLRVQERLEYEVIDIATIETALQRCAAELARQLRARREFCRSLMVCLILEDQNQLRQRERLLDPLDLEAGLLRAARRLLTRMQRAIDRAVVEVVLEAGELGAGSGIQLELLDLHSNALPHLRLRHLRATIHHLQQRYGPGCVVTAHTLWQARRIDLWTYPLCHQRHETVQVITDGEGAPVRFQRGRGEVYQVAGIHRHWRENEWEWREVRGEWKEDLMMQAVYRIETRPTGMYELRLDDEGRWRLCGIAD